MRKKLNIITSRGELKDFIFQKFVPLGSKRWVKRYTWKVMEGKRQGQYRVYQEYV